MSIALALLGLGIASQFVDTTNVCTVTSTVEIQIRERREAFRINTDCGTFTLSPIPLRGVDYKEAAGMWHRVNIGEQYEITSVREGFGFIGTYPSVVEITPHN